MLKLILTACFCSGLLNATAQFATSSNSANNINNTNSGNVGIGTSNPWDKLEVAGNLRLFTGNPDGPRFIWYGGVGGVQEYRTRIAPDGHLAFFPSEGIATTLALTQNRNVGIGVNNPWSRLDVRTDGLNAGDQNALNLNNPSNAAYATVSIVMGLNSEASSMISSQRNNLTKGSSLFFHTSDASGTNKARMWINDAGNVGIGTISPRTKLDIWNGELAVTGTDLNGTAFLTSRGGVAFFGNNYYADGLAVAPGGNVGIGTSTPGSYKLAVEGTIGARKVKVTQEIPWADFVFENDYRLMPLTELSKFIEEHKHLPDVPTTEEIKANGLDLGANQALLLQKIEELTLYIIELKKENEQQQREINELKMKKGNK